MNKILFTDYFGLTGAQLEEANIKICQSFENGCKASKKHFEKYGNDPHKALYKMYQGYLSENEVIDILNKLGNKHWEHLDPDAAYFKFDSPTGNNNKPDLICKETGETIEVKKGPVDIDENGNLSTTYHGIDKTPEAYWQWFFHDANCLIVRDVYYNITGYISREEFLKSPETAYEIFRDITGSLNIKINLYRIGE